MTKCYDIENTVEVGTECYDCGGPAEAVDLNAYGPGKPETYCYKCHIANTFNSDDAISVTFNEEPWIIVAELEADYNTR